MWETVELREIRVFLTLAEELHFGRTAERLGLTQSRVSQSLRALEHKLGVQLVHRTSRRVSLTPDGERFRADADAAYGELARVLRSTGQASRRLAGTLRLGMISAAAGGPRLRDVVHAFESSHPDCTVQIAALPYADRFGPLRRGEVNAMIARLPLELADVVVGPVLVQEPRVLAVAHDHPLAHREAVSIEDIAEFAVGRFDVLTKEQAAEYLPAKTPSGRPIPRSDSRIDGHNELVIQIAQGAIVHPTVASFASYVDASQIVCVPITDMPPSKSALAWRRRDPDPRLREFSRIAKAVLTPTTRAGDRRQLRAG